MIVPRKLNQRQQALALLSIKVSITERFRKKNVLRVSNITSAKVLLAGGEGRMQSASSSKAPIMAGMCHLMLHEALMKEPLLAVPPACSDDLPGA